MPADLHNNIKATAGLNPGAIATDTTTEGAIIDRQGYKSVEWLIASGTLTDGTYTPAIFESDASDMTGEAEVTDANALLGTVAGATFAAGAPDNTVKKIGYRGSKRYVQLKIVSASTTSGGTLAAVAILGDPIVAPVA